VSFCFLDGSYGQKGDALKLPNLLLDEAENDAYIYFDRYVRPLPKRPDGSINRLAKGYHNNDVDAFRHAYVSGIFTYEYGERVANWLGWMNEFTNLGQPPSELNMDIWNNAVGRELAKKYLNPSELAKAVKDALESGKLIISPKDERVYSGAINSKPSADHSVIVLKENHSGANEVFFDLIKSATMTRAEFITAIDNGKYPGYATSEKHGVRFPISKRDQTDKNNLG
jgi:hypothetical protein